jgi:hypothetical protein
MINPDNIFGDYINLTNHEMVVAADGKFYQLQDSSSKTPRAIYTDGDPEGFIKTQTLVGVAFLPNYIGQKLVVSKEAQKGIRCLSREISIILDINGYLNSRSYGPDALRKKINAISAKTLYKKENQLWYWLEDKVGLDKIELAFKRLKKYYHRTDVYSPGKIILDKTGKPVACQGLMQYQMPQIAGGIDEIV